MPKEYKIQPNTPAEVVLNELSKHLETSCVADGIAFHEQSGAKTAMEMAQNTPNQGWAVWDLTVRGADVDPAIRKVLISKIKDPMMAFQVYLSLAWLTDEEDKLLEEKFKGKLPTAEAELEKGIVTRAKHGSNSI